MPNDIPEKWCGAYGAILTLSEIWRRAAGNTIQEIIYDVSAADISIPFLFKTPEIKMRYFEDGGGCVEHGGIFPMGFFPCQDGFVALLGRSRRDWKTSGLLWEILIGHRMNASTTLFN